MKNIAGEFVVEFEGKEYQMKINYGLIERWERKIINRPIFDMLELALNRRAGLSDVAIIFHTAMQEANDTRLTLEQVGQKILQAGMPNFYGLYLTMLNYAFSGEMELEVEETDGDEPKKK